MTEKIIKNLAIPYIESPFFRKLNNDIKDSGMDPTRHYVLYGRDEGRPYK